MSSSICMTMVAARQADPFRIYQTYSTPPSCRVNWAPIQKMHQECYELLVDAKMRREAERESEQITSKRDSAANALEGLNWVWWQRIMADEGLAAYAELKSIRNIVHVKSTMELRPTDTFSIKAGQLIPEGFHTLQRKLIAEEARWEPALPTFANPPVLKNLLPELAKRVSCTVEEYVLLLQAQDSVDQDGEIMFPDEASEDFKRLFPDYRP